MINIVCDGLKYICMDKLYEYDFGQSLQITGLTLTGPTVEAHFCIKGNDDSVLVMGTLDGDVAVVPVPNSMLEDAGLINTYIYERNDTAGKTVYKFELRVERRADLPAATYDPTEEEVSYFTHVIEVITEQAEIVQATKDELLAGLTIGDVETLPAGSAATADLVEDGGRIKLDLGIPQGEKGEKGEKGDTEGLTIDTEISATSTNPVQNKVINGVLTGKADKTYVDTAIQSAKLKNIRDGAGTGAVEEGCLSGNTAVSATGQYAHAEGMSTKAQGGRSHAEGGGTTASGNESHAEGAGTKATADGTHAEGGGSTASGSYAHAEGISTKATAQGSHAEGNLTEANGMFSHAGGLVTKADGFAQTVIGEYNLASGTSDRHTGADDELFIIGNGEASARSNGHTVSKGGVGWYQTDVKVGGTGHTSATLSLVDMNTALAGKADKSYVDTEVAKAKVTVDSTVSSNSENPVQNKAVKQYVDNATVNKVTKFTVTISQENSSYVADKTYQQIAYAYIGGNDVVAVYNSITYPLFTIYNNTLFFGISGLLLGDVMTSGFAIAQDNTVTPVNENIALSDELLNINTALDTKASTDVATQSANGLMSSTDKAHLDAVYADYSSALTALGVI